MKKTLLLLTAFFIMGSFAACTKETESSTEETNTIEEMKSAEETNTVEKMKSTEETNPLEGTKWKLAGIVDTSTNELMVLEPKYLDDFFSRVYDVNDFYTLMFDKDDAFTGRTTTNIIMGTYTFLKTDLENLDKSNNEKYVTNSIFFDSFGGTKLGELGDGKLWWDIFPTIRFFSLQEKELKLFYNDNKNYFLFKLLEPCEPHLKNQ